MLTLRPLTLAQANDLVAQFHRHHKPMAGHRFSIGAFPGDRLVGAAIVGRRSPAKCRNTTSPK
jgi:hypothetical protein